QVSTMSGNSTMIIMTARISTGKTRKYNLLQSNFRCMKIAATSIALMMATIRISIMLVPVCPRKKLNTNDSAVHMHRATKTLMYVANLCSSYSSAYCWSSFMNRSPRHGRIVVASHQIQQRKQENPHDID